MVEFWRNPARWMKDITARESTIEKPYLEDGSSPRKMNLRWPNIEPPGGGGGFTSTPSVPPEPPEPPEGPEKPPSGTRQWTFIMDEGYCDIGPVGNLKCGDSFSFNVGLNLVPLRISRTFTATFYSFYTPASKMYVKNPVFVGPTYSHVFYGDIYEDVEGAGAVCGAVSLKGEYFQSITIEIPETMNNPDLRNLQDVTILGKVTWSNIGYQCGCSEFEITCTECDDTGMSVSGPETIDRNQSKTITITDPTGKGSPFSWSVSGTGFTLNSNETTGLTNKLNADGTACGTATITVTGCAGSTDSCEVRCTNGQWVQSDTCGNSSGQAGELISGKLKINEWICTICPGKNCGTDCGCEGLPDCHPTSCACECCNALCGSPRTNYDENPWCVGSTTGCTANGYIEYTWDC